jgi:predicted nuclease with TOPRIM domain
VKLYELGDARDILDGFLAETEGEETPELKDLFEQLDGEVQQKVARTGLYIKELEADLTALDLECNRLAGRRNALKKRVDGLAGYLLANMERLGVARVEAPAITVAVQNAAPALVVDETVWTAERLDKLRESASPWVTVKPETVQLNKVALLRAFKADPGAFAGLSLRIPRWLALR